MSDYDHIIVGAGPAGCALAARLSEDRSRRVLLLEAGGSGRGAAVRIPASGPRLFRSRHDWAFETAPQDSLDGRRVFFAQGKGLGGSSLINTMSYVRGHPDDYDGWDVPGWGFADLLPYFTRAERNARGADAHHGGAGPWHVEDLRDPHPLSRAFVAAAAGTGIPANPDFNGEQLDGAGLTQVMQRRGRRWSAADAYLRPARRRRNLQIVTDAHVMKVVVRDGRAESVRYRTRAGEQLARARRDIVLCAGAFGSPQLLMLSGIGPAEHLRAHGIDVVHDLPGVGQNLQDHPMVPLLYALRRPISLLAAQDPRHLLRYLLTHRGLLATNGVEAFAFVRSVPSAPAPDVELGAALALWLDEGLTAPTTHGFTVGVIALQPRSRGMLTLADADPRTPPTIRPNYLADPADLNVLARGVEIARRIVARRELDDVRGAELEPGPDAVRPDEIEAWIRSRAQTVHHPVGTCRMGTDELAVVDPELRVRGVEGLRVADASIMPILPRGHTTAPVMAIGERAADLVRGTAARRPGRPVGEPPSAGPR